MGRRILDDVLDDLINVHSMSNASLIILIGQSAGGIGVLLNANRLKSRISRDVPNARLKAVIDSSWLFDLPYSFLCNNFPNDQCFTDEIFSNSLG